MTDADCVAFLQWALPRLGMRWPGFRKVRRQVCRRISRRMAELHLPDAAAYRAHLEAHPEEWALLDGLCRITISRFYRDRGVWERLGREVLPELAAWCIAEGRPALDAWSAGCASGEEPYTLVLLWERVLRPEFPDLELRVGATDADAHLLARARGACYPQGTLRELPETWREAAFRRGDGEWCLDEGLRERVRFRQEDIRETQPAGPHDLILCRNLAFTYFDEATQVRLAGALADCLRPGGWLVVGSHEWVPADCGLTGDPPCYRKPAG